MMHHLSALSQRLIDLKVLKSTALHDALISKVMRAPSRSCYLSQTLIIHDERYRQNLYEDMLSEHFKRAQDFSEKKQLAKALFEFDRVIASVLSHNKPLSSHLKILIVKAYTGKARILFENNHDNEVLAQVHLKKAAQYLPQLQEMVELKHKIETSTNCCNDSSISNESRGLKI